MNNKRQLKSCPFCDEEILFEAIKCKHCKSDLTDVIRTCPFCSEQITTEHSTCPHCDEALPTDSNFSEGGGSASFNRNLSFKESIIYILLGIGGVVVAAWFDIV